MSNVPPHELIDLWTLSEPGQLAVGMVVTVHAGQPTAQVLPQLSGIPAGAVGQVTMSLLVLTRLLAIGTAGRARSSGATNLTMAETPPPGTAEALGGNDRLNLMTGDLIELLEAWLADDASAESLMNRYASRWGQDGLYRMAIAADAQLSAGDAGWPDLKWAVDQLRQLEQSPSGAVD
jgi:hypothetical protein